MELFDFSAGICGVLLFSAYAIPLFPSLQKLLQSDWGGNNLWLVFASGIAGDLLLARYSDLLTQLVQRPYGAFSAEVVIALLMLAAALFWLGIAQHLIPSMGRAVQRIAHVLTITDEMLRPALGSKLLVLGGAFGVILMGSLALYLWFAVPSVLVNVDRALELESAQLSQQISLQKSNRTEARRRHALSVFGHYAQLQNRLNEAFRDISCLTDCRQKIRQTKSEIANTLAGYQIRQATAAAFLIALDDEAKITSLNDSILHIAGRDKLSVVRTPIPEAGASEDQLHLSEMATNQARTDSAISLTISEAVLSPGLEKLTPALRDPVLLLVFLIEIIVILTILLRHSSRTS